MQIQLSRTAPCMYLVASRFYGKSSAIPFINGMSQRKSTGKKIGDHHGSIQRLLPYLGAKISPMPHTTSQCACGNVSVCPPPTTNATMRFLKHFLDASFVLGDAAADQRGRYMCELVRANRDLFLNQSKLLNEKGHNIKYSQGFIALYRSKEAANNLMQETLHHLKRLKRHISLNKIKP